MSLTEKTRIGVSLAGFGTIAGFLIWVGMTINSAGWRLQTVERKTEALETKVEALPTKADFVQVRIELQQLQAANEATMKALRRRPR